MNTGYKTITPIQIGNLLHSLATGSVTWSTARVWFAALEMVAIREAASRVRRQRRDKRQVEPEYRRTELSKLTGLSARAIGKAVSALRQTGLAILTTRAIEVVNDSMPEAGETIQMISGGRSPKRPIPIPRPILRYLAQQPKAAIGKVMLGYICRGMTIDRQGGDIRGVGTVKASWLADVLELSLRSVRYAQAKLQRMGWIGKDTGSKQWKLNRHGAWFSIELDWNPPEIPSRQADAKVPKDQPGLAPLPPEKCTPVAPPKKDPKTLSESKNQKSTDQSGIYERNPEKTSSHRSVHPQEKSTAHPQIPPSVHSEVCSQQQPPAPRLSNITLADLRDAGRLRSLLRQAIERRWIGGGEADALNFFAAAVRARNTSARDPVRVFVTLVKRRQWSHVTQAQEDEGRLALQSSVPFQPVGATRGASSFGRLGEIVKSLVRPVGQTTPLLTN